MPSRLRSAGLLRVQRGVVLALTFSGCGGTPPTGPTGPSRAQLNDPVPIELTLGFPATVTTTWSCLSGDRDGIFAGTSSNCIGRLLSSRSLHESPLIAPCSPRELFSSVTGTTVTLTWGTPCPSIPPSSYLLEVGSSPGATDILSQFDTHGLTRGITINGVPPGTYYVRVRATNSLGSSPPSNEVIVVVPSPTPCTGAPGVPTQLAGSVVGSTVTLTWKAPVNGCPVDRYRIDVGSDSGRSDVASIVTGNANTSFTATAVLPGTYYIEVRAGNASSVGAASDSVVVTVSGPPVNLSGVWAGTMTRRINSADTSVRVSIVFVQDGDQLSGLGRVGLAGSLSLTLTTQVGGLTASYGGTLDLGRNLSCSRSAPLFGGIFADTVAYTMRGSFSGTNPDCLFEDDTFNLQRQ